MNRAQRRSKTQKMLINGKVPATLENGNLKFNEMELLKQLRADRVAQKKQIGMIAGNDKHLAEELRKEFQKDIDLLDERIRKIKGQ